MNKKKFTTSKRLTWGVFLIWAFSIGGSFLAKVLFAIDTGYIVTSTTASLSIVLTGYFSKSFLENKEQYGQSNTKGEDANETQTNQPLI